MTRSTPRTLLSLTTLVAALLLAATGTAPGQPSLARPSVGPDDVAPNDPPSLPAYLLDASNEPALGPGPAGATVTTDTHGGQRPPSTPTRAAPPDPGLRPPAPIRLSITARGGSGLLARFATTVREDLSLVNDVALVRRDSEAALSATVELTDGSPWLHARLHSGDALRWEARTALGGLDATPAEVEARLRRAAHVASDGTLGALTGNPGSFDSTLVYARRASRRRKDVWRADADGRAATRISSGRVSAMLPTMAHGDVWYSIVDPRGLFLTRAGLGEVPVLESDGLSMGVQPCGARIVFTSTRDGDTEIYSATPEGHDVRRLTHHPGIDVSPTCNAVGDLAFVSNRDGRPQIHVLSARDLHPRRIEQPDTENQTPNFCARADRDLIAFTRVRRGMQVWMLDEQGAARRISPEGRGFKDPAFSPDCRLIAYVAPDGIWISSLDGRRRRRVVRGSTETVRWSSRAP